MYFDSVAASRGQGAGSGCRVQGQDAGCRVKGAGCCGSFFVAVINRHGLANLCYLTFNIYGHHLKQHKLRQKRTKTKLSTLPSRVKQMVFSLFSCTANNL